MQDTANSEDFAIILAGGQSSRMGQDKTLLRLGEETLLERVFRIASPLVSRVVIMLSQTQDEKEITKRLCGDFCIGRDTASQQGPLQGIADAVNLLPESGRFVYILSCDLPYITSDWLKKLRSDLLSNNQAAIACTSSDGFQNPLIAIYRFMAVKEAQSVIASGRRSCLALLDPHRVISREPLDGERQVIANVNTPEEYQKVLDTISLV